ncbi:hypothetical protein QW060_23215 [Myroides ceti]|uniref:Uncharacterized protein n=1 Tax=Paenimyroides ceti TaxID=395087 RepID=A0ABT8CZV3_9FLAO|nr:hypothetical protein [Paenimyroides ceti]MDN3709847.1 hypothetical protein [Paenimyroides ceti]
MRKIYFINQLHMDTIYQITEQLKEDGFSINYIKNLITRNQGNTYFNTLDYFISFGFQILLYLL